MIFSFSAFFYFFKFFLRYTDTSTHVQQKVFNKNLNKLFPNEHCLSEIVILVKVKPQQNTTLSIPKFFFFFLSILFEHTTVLYTKYTQFTFWTKIVTTRHYFSSKNNFNRNSNYMTWFQFKNNLCVLCVQQLYKLTISHFILECSKI